jgi:hypothetical protein
MLVGKISVRRLLDQAKNDKRGPLDGSLAWLVARYRETTVWQGLSRATKKTFFAKS